MRPRLLILGCFAHDPQSVLTAVREFALVGFELLLNARLLVFAERNQGGTKLHVAILADPQQGRTVVFSHDSQFPLGHGNILRRQRGRSTPVQMKRHHYQRWTKRNLACVPIVRLLG